jgi:aminoglycoside 3-N-acetyltransferase
MDDVEALVDLLGDDLLGLGLRPGGCLLVHSSLKALGQVSGGAETVIRGLLAALGDEGTLLMPALSYAHVTPEYPVFDLMHTPSNVGLIAETFRRREGTRRSLHPTHSICAHGPRANELLKDHELDSTPCGVHSPLHLLPQVDGQILMLGCGLEPNTSMHAVEELVEPIYLFDPPIDCSLILASGEDLVRSYRPHNFRGWAQRYERIEGEMDHGLMWGRVLKAECWIIEARAMWSAALAKLRQDGLYFVEKVE